MRKLQYFSIYFLILPFLFTGASHKQTWEKPVLPTLVTQIRVAGYDGSNSFSRRYTHAAKMSAVLSYLRWLDSQGTAHTDPEQLTDSSFDITLYYSDGQTRVYRQRANRFLSKDCRPWERIDPQQAQVLLPLLLAIPGD